VIDPLTAAIEATRSALEENASGHWVLGFSGGKDSTALLKIVCAAVRRARRAPTMIDVIYCDTGVENPALDLYAKSLLKRLSDEFLEQQLPLRTVILKAPVKDRFFVKVIGRGYPPPTNSFRWCTKNLRILPVSRFVAAAARGDAVVTLGMRRAESMQRNRTLQRAGGGMWQTQLEGGRKYRVFLPIINLDVSEVWDGVFMLPRPIAVDPASLERLYRGASGECPIIKSPMAPPCASGRFGCWTCTVVRRDKSAEALVASGHANLKPYLDFRNWLADFRNDRTTRWATRRNGRQGPGPFNIRARAEILARVRVVERAAGSPIIDLEEIGEIHRLWSLDKGDMRELSTPGNELPLGEPTPPNRRQAAAPLLHFVTAPSA
jgi:DNA sulfur modification protein DndC